MSLNFFFVIQHESNEAFAESEYDNVVPDDSIAAVLVGLDRAANYRKLAKAHTYLTQHKLKGEIHYPVVEFLATNRDATFPHHHHLYPGAGTISQPLIMSTGRQPTVLGKPSSAMLEAIESEIQFDKSTAIMIGDRLNTDIRFGINSGLGGTLAVLTGVENEETILNADLDERPSFYIDSLGSFWTLYNSR